LVTETLRINISSRQALSTILKIIKLLKIVRKSI
jgi:hypothetical protein